MLIFKKIRKVLLLTVLSVMFASTALSQTSAASIAPPAGYDYFNVSLRPVENYTVDLSDFSIDKDYLGVTTSYNVKRKTVFDNALSFIKFDITRPAGTIVNNAFLSLVGGGNGAVSLYNVDDNWIRQISASSISALRNTKAISTEIISDPDYLTTYFNNVDLSYLPQEGQTSLNFVLLGNKSTSASFDSYNMDEPSTGPMLQANGLTPAPVPEPSSIVLGLMSLGSMLGFRRKKLRNSLKF